MHLNASHGHFQLARWPTQSGLQDPSSRLKAYDRSSLSYKVVRITIVPSGSTLVYRSQTHDPNRRISPISLIGHAYTRCFQTSILLVQLGAQSLHFQQANQMHPNPLVVIPFHLLNDKNG